MRHVGSASHDLRLELLKLMKRSSLCLIPKFEIRDVYGNGITGKNFLPLPVMVLPVKILFTGKNTLFRNFGM